jgi:hypothetical protein
MSTTELTATEWDKAMAFVLAAEDDEPKDSTKGQKPPTRRRPAYVAPVKASTDGSGPSGDSTSTTTTDLTPTALPGGPNPDLTNRTSNASLPDGSFMIITADDVQNCVDKVLNADQQNPRPLSHPWYEDVKAHIARRASDLGVTNLVPDNWQMSIG